MPRQISAAFQSVWQLLLGCAGAHKYMGREGPPTAPSPGHFLMRAAPGVSFAAGSWLGQGCRWIGAFRLKPTGIFPIILKECWMGSYRKLPWLSMDNSVLTTACHLQPCRYCTLAAAGIHQVLFLLVCLGITAFAHMQNVLQPFCGSHVSYPKPLTVQAHPWINVLH